MKVEIQSYYTAKELAELKISHLPSTDFRVREKAKRENWVARKRTGRGGGLEYAFESLPPEIQAEIKQKCYKSLITPNAEEVIAKREMKEIAIRQRDLNKLTDVQRATADARLRMALLVEQYEADLGSRTKAIKLVSQLSRENALPVDEMTDWNEVCATALAKNIKGKTGVGTRKLHQWCLDADKCETATDRLKMLSPAKQGQPEIEVASIDWLPEFMSIYRNTNGMCITEAYRVFERAYIANHGSDAEVPHYDAVRRALAKMPSFVREQGRITGAKMKELRTYIKRNWNADWFENNDVWVGDGHSLKMKVQHPDHGRPFTPELTIIIDAPSRYVVGWSLSYAESTFAVADALRHGMVNHGIPAIYYSDNGGGQTNNMLDADITGILPRLGVHHETGIPGNPQGRGIIERFMKVVPKYIAQQFETYYGNGADRETTRKTLVAVNSLAKAEAEGKALTPLQEKAKGKLPTWQELLEVVEAAVHWYNHEHEHSSIGTTPVAMRRAIASKMSDDAVIQLTEAEAKDMYRPAFTRTVQRAYLQLHNGYYWHKALEALDGEQVVLYVDQHDPSSVIVRHQNGQYICEAVLDGNKRDAFPKSLIEQSRDNRANRRIKKLAEEQAKAEAELRPTIEHDDLSALTALAVGSDLSTTPAKREYALFASDLED